MIAFFMMKMMGRLKGWDQLDKKTNWINKRLPDRMGSLFDVEQAHHTGRACSYGLLFRRLIVRLFRAVLAGDYLNDDTGNGDRKEYDPTWVPKVK